MLDRSLKLADLSCCFGDHVSWCYRRLESLAGPFLDGARHFLTYHAFSKQLHLHVKVTYLLERAGNGAPAKISGDDDGSYRTHTRGDKHGIKHGVKHRSEPLDQDGERAATQDSTDDLLDGVGDGSATVFGMATPVSPTVAI